MTRNPTRFLLTVSALLMKLFRPNKQRRRRKYQSLSLTFEASQIETLELRRMFSSISVGGSEHLGQNIPNTASSSDPTQSVPVVSLSEVGGTYNGLPYVPTVTVVSDLGRAVSGSVTITYFPGTTADGQGSVAAPSAAGTYTAVADFVSHDPNFGNAQSAPLTYTISKAIPHMQVTAPSGTYSAVPFTAKAKVLGFTGFLIPGSTTITYYAGTTISGTGTNSPPTDAGTYSVVASFISRNPNFADIQSSSSTFVIRKATPKVQAIDPSGNFNGNPFTATISAKDRNGNSIDGTSTFAYYSGKTVSGTGSSTAPTAPGDYTVVASFVSNNVNYTNAISPPLVFSIVPTVATKLVVQQQPNQGIAGLPFSPALTIAVTDDQGNIVLGDQSTVTLTLQNGLFSNGTSTTAVTVTNGIASFVGLTINSAGTFVISASDGTLQPVSLQNIAIKPATPSKLVIEQQPTMGTAGQALGPPLKVAVVDQYGNIVTSNGSFVTMILHGGKLANGEFSETESFVNGVALFGGLTIITAGTYSLSVSNNTLPPLTIQGITVSPAVASKLVVLQQPMVGTAGQALSTDLKVAIEDVFGNVVNDDASIVTVNLPNGQFSNGTSSITATAVNGIATFTGISINTSGSQVLTVSSGSLARVVTRSIRVQTSAATNLTVSQQPTAGLAGRYLTPVLVIAVDDAFGNLVTGENSFVTITLSSGTFSDGNTSESARVYKGLAIFMGLSIKTTGSFTLTASDGALTSATTASILVQ